MLPAVFIDIETGGLLDTHPITQIACVSISSSWSEIAAFERKIIVNAAECDSDALKVNHYDPGTWAEQAVPVEKAAADLAAWLRDHSSLNLTSAAGRPYRIARLVGHNIVSFDLPRIRRMMDLARITFWNGCWWYPLDTYQLSLWKFSTRPERPRDYKLGTLARFFNIETPSEHDALADVRTCVQVTKALNEMEMPRV